MRTQGRWQLVLAIILAAVSPAAFSINLQPPCPNTSTCPNYVVRDLTSYPPANSVALADTQEYEFDILSSSNQQVGVTLDYILQTFTFDIPHSVPPFDNIQAFAEIDLSDNGGLLFKQAINAFNDGQQSVKSTVVGTVASPAAAPSLAREVSATRNRL